MKHLKYIMIKYITAYVCNYGNIFGIYPFHYKFEFDQKLHDFFISLPVYLKLIRILMYKQSYS